MRLYYDCEFLEDGKTIDLISIGMIRDDGARYYAVNSETDFTAVKSHGWLLRNVVPYLPLVNRKGLDDWLSHEGKILHIAPPSFSMLDLDVTDTRVKPRQVIANEVRDFILARPDPQLWAWFSAYDHVVLCQLWGPMIRLPKGVPLLTNDVKQEAERLGNPDLSWQRMGGDTDEMPEHNALAGAEITRRRHQRLIVLEARETPRPAQ